MKKFFNIIMVTIVAVLLVPAASFAHGHHGGTSVAVSFGASSCSTYSYSSVSISSGCGSFHTEYIRPATMIVQPSGHWETRVLGYQPVVKQIRHEAITELRWIEKGNCMGWSECIVSPAWTETVVVQEPIFGNVWVQDVQQVVVTQAPVVYSSCSSSFGFSGTIH